MKSKFPLLYLILLIYFTTVFITYIPGVLLPFWKEDFNLTNSTVSLLGATFFLAYGITSLPLGVLLDRVGEKRFLLGAGGLILAGSLLFALVPQYITGLISLFIMGVGLTAFQIAGNLLVKKLDKDPEKYSRNLTFAQVIQGIGGLSGGVIIGFLINSLGLEWSFLYNIFAALSLVLLISLALIPLPGEASPGKPAVESTEGGLRKRELLKNPLMFLFAGAIFVYVGIEQGVGTWLSSFLIRNFGMVKTGSAKIVSLFWLAQSIGRFSGAFVLNRLSGQQAMRIYAGGALISLGAAVFVPVKLLSIAGFILTGFFTSIMFPTIFSRAVNSFHASLQGTVAGILCTAIIGGAVIPPVIGLLGDISGNLGPGLAGAGAFCFLYIMWVFKKERDQEAVRLIKKGPQQI